MESGIWMALGASIGRKVAVLPDGMLSICGS